MAKEIRFTALVQKSGRPEAAALWTDPKDNPAFMKAVRENRVVTVLQNPTGNKKDFGLIGFHQQKFVTYLVFPKRLPKLDDAQVIGIKYELLQEQSEDRSAKRPIQSSKTVVRTPIQNGAHFRRDGVSVFKARLESAKKFEVKVTRVATMETIVTVSAKTMSEAEENALKMVKDQKFQPDDIQAQVKCITEI